MEEQLINLVSAATNNALAVVIVIVLIWFLMFRAWPYYTQTYIPDKREHERALLSGQKLIASHLEAASIALETFARAIEKTYALNDTPQRQSVKANETDQPTPT